jgi:antibiotic biosynthesis monooxygenase (ABM) superfamily enzyme
MSRPSIVTVHLRYEIDPDKVAEFKEYGQRWIRLVERLGGVHHGYFLPSEGDSDEAFALFTFSSLREYEEYRTAAAADPECIAAVEYATETKCIRRYERRFLSPVFE